MNAASEHRLKEVYPPLAEAVRAMHEQLLNEDIIIRVTSGYRSFAEQQKLFNRGRTTAGSIVTNARPGHSMHNFGLAVDLAPGILGAHPWRPDWNDASPSWEAMMVLGEALGLECGGRWKNFPDKPHFQWGHLPKSPTNAMRADYREGGLELVWHRVSIREYV